MGENMITISLDEQGVFENNNLPTGDIVMIAGIVYDDLGDTTDLEREKKRIKTYFSKICQSFNAIYPRALHVGHGQDSKVGLVKREYANTLGDFLKHGRYKGIEVSSPDGIKRSGCYYVFALVKSRNGKKTLISSNVSNLINESNASNLYMHMVEDTVSRLLFYNNIFVDKEEVSLDLATRVYKGVPGEDLTNHTDVGYRTQTVNDGELVFLTNSDVFRTALERDMLYESENDIDVKNLVARSINYNTPDAGHEMLYLADAVCTCLGYKNDYGKNKPYLTKIWNKMKMLSDERRLIFAYDEVDTSFTEAWRCAENGDIYKALSVEYDALNYGNEVSDFYSQVWEKELFCRITKKVDVSSFSTAVRKFAQSTRNNNLSQNKLIFVFDKLEVLASQIDFGNEQDKAILYELYDSGVSTYNHVGWPEKARLYAEKCSEYTKYIGIERELRNRNKIAVGLCDSFRYDEACKIIEDSYLYCQAIFEAQKKLLGENNSYNALVYGIVASQLGQIYSFMNDTRAEDMFLQALNLFDKGTADYYITESYLLHYYLSIRNIEKYEYYAKEYFGGNSELQNQLEYLIVEGSERKNPIISLKFAIFVYLKSLYTFYLENLSEELIDKVLNIEDTIGQLSPEGLSQINGHPWEISYKYLALIAFTFKKSKLTTYYIKKMETALTINGATLEAIAIFGDIEISRVRSPGMNIQDKIDKLCNLIRKENSNVCIDNNYESVEKIITYTYR